MGEDRFGEGLRIAEEQRAAAKEAEGKKLGGDRFDTGLELGEEAREKAKDEELKKLAPEDGKGK